MKHCKTSEHQTIRRILLSTCATALAVACTVALPQPAHTATHALGYSGASGEYGVPRGARRRHPALPLPGLRGALGGRPREGRVTWEGWRGAMANGIAHPQRE